MKKILLILFALAFCLIPLSIRAQVSPWPNNNTFITYSSLISMIRNAAFFIDGSRFPNSVLDTFITQEVMNIAMNSPVGEVETSYLSGSTARLNIALGDTVIHNGVKSRAVVDAVVLSENNPPNLVGLQYVEIEQYRKLKKNTTSHPRQYSIIRQWLPTKSGTAKLLDSIYFDCPLPTTDDILLFVRDIPCAKDNSFLTAESELCYAYLPILIDRVVLRCLAKLNPQSTPTKEVWMASLLKKTEKLYNKKTDWR